jgi:23S rRNA (guanosine2251-2'-O)-methyltransferase
MATREVVIIAHNIRSLWNVGALFRSADAFGVSHIHLTGYTAQPPRKEISKTALGAEEWIPWSYDKDPFEIIERRRKDGFLIAALELTEKSDKLWSVDPKAPVCLVLGHEVLGVSPELLAVCDKALHIPMQGKKSSLNVSVACGVALYELTRPSA